MPIIQDGKVVNLLDPDSTIASIATGLAMFGSSVYLAQYMQLARGATPTQAGLMTIPMILGLLVSSTVIGGLITRTGVWKRWLVIGAVLLIAGTALLGTLHYDTSFWLVSLYMFLLGAGVGMTMQNLVLVVQNSVRREDMGAGSSLVAFFRSLGGAIGVVLQHLHDVSERLEEHRVETIGGLVEDEHLGILQQRGRDRPDRLEAHPAGAGGADLDPVVVGGVVARGDHRPGQVEDPGGEVELVGRTQPDHDHVGG